MWQLIFASCHRLIFNKKKKNMPKGCLMVMADPSDLDHGKNYDNDITIKYQETCCPLVPIQFGLKKALWYFQENKFNPSIRSVPSCYMTCPLLIFEADTFLTSVWSETSPET